MFPTQENKKKSIQTQEKISHFAVFCGELLPSVPLGEPILFWDRKSEVKGSENVRFNGATSTDTRSQTTPPGANGQPIPDGWVNSTVIFNATASQRDPSVTLATLAAFNLPTYSGPHWGINFNAGQEPNHYVNSAQTL